MLANRETTVLNDIYGRQDLLLANLRTTAQKIEVKKQNILALGNQIVAEQGRIHREQ